MKRLFEGVVKYTKQNDSGLFSRVTEKYVFQSETFGNAEETLYEEIGSFVKGEFSINKINPLKNVQDVICDDPDLTLWKVKYKAETLTDSDKPKVSTFTMLIAAGSSKEAETGVSQIINDLYHQPQIFHVSDTKSYFLPTDESKNSNKDQSVNNDSESDEND